MVSAAIVRQLQALLTGWWTTANKRQEELRRWLQSPLEMGEQIDDVQGCLWLGHGAAFAVKNNPGIRSPLWLFGSCIKPKMRSERMRVVCALVFLSSAVMGEDFQGKVIGIIDGDTVDVSRSEGNEHAFDSMQSMRRRGPGLR